MSLRGVLEKAPAVLGWTIAGFVLQQLALIVFLDTWHPEVYDPEYGARLALLRARLAEAPERPLLLLLGSSRTTLGFRPEILPPLGPTSGPQPLPFNFSHFGAGAPRNLVLLQRLLRLGIRPRWLVVELMPAKLNHDSHNWLLTTAVCSDLPWLQRYAPPWKACSVYARVRLLPYYRQRTWLLREGAPGWPTPGTKLVSDGMVLDPLGGDSRWQAVTDLSPADRLHCNAAIRAGYEPEFRDFSVKAGPDLAVRDLLSLCRRENIPVVLILTPESPEFRSYYPPQALAELDRYCRQLRREYGVPVIDAREWLDDRDFMDGHHPLLRGADAFTLRLGREVLRPLVAGELAPTEGSESPQEVLDSRTCTR